MDWEVSLQVGSAGPSQAIPPGWYVEDPRDGLLLGNVPVNALNEWDVAKLGWFKSRSHTEDHIDSTGQQIIRQAFKVQVEDCVSNNFQYQVKDCLKSFVTASSLAQIMFKFQFFRGFLDHNQLHGARRIDEMFPFIKKASSWRRHVEVTHRESPLLVMTMQHRNKVQVSNH